MFDTDFLLSNDSICKLLTLKKHAKFIFKLTQQNGAMYLFFFSKYVNHISLKFFI